MFWFWLSLLYSLSVKLVSQNIHGLRGVSRIQFCCTALDCDVLCMQECRWTRETVEGVRDFWVGVFFCNLSHDGSGGVAVFLRRGVFDDVEEVFHDDLGRMIVLDIVYRWLFSSGICVCSEY